ncbi:2-nitropropane dioxygenase [Porphyromonas crevioricanis]|uniref:2-nitropropane dioxygenase n=1 Tax=Porphyromonas crevioricanis TaxID=393921 RepID=A0A0A2FVE4_9PORP|nr:nitronate monooxygenase [Porphyromonas crevioricanis]KGN90201.1 2-nitropropane dioxygenase [Porphyromonas crevioricanis]KGN94958.1 2-nitropropane dioxygenase [Porphyromonas crevioricanis]GAD07982.1 Enoyl-(acyl-carrier-protein) reductase [Porphyromonas crevioricanis JCM 13913]SQH72605.1 Nitronate monooxygenase [Porphyromonas crevioricanis]
MNRLCRLLNIELPVIAGGMVWCSGWRLASAVSNNGGLGLIGAGSMHPDTLRYHIEQCAQATNKTWGVNIPLMYPQLDEIMDIVISSKVPVVVTSAGSPKLWTDKLHKAGSKVLHVVSSAKFAKKSEEAGVDAVIAEGFEAGGHNGREETTTLCLIPQVVNAVNIPVVAAGGIALGRSIAAVMALGADGVQIGTRFALSEESSASEAFKEYCRNSGEGTTMLTLKKVSPTRLLDNEFSRSVIAEEANGASKEQLQEMMGKGRAKMGIFEGQINEGMLEIGQAVSHINKSETVADIMQDLQLTYEAVVKRLSPRLRPM